MLSMPGRKLLLSHVFDYICINEIAKQELCFFALKKNTIHEP
jgi:hypothetical protein